MKGGAGLPGRTSRLREREEIVMGAQLVESTCSYCKGSGKAERLMEQNFTGDWVPNTILGHDIADAWIAEDNQAPIRWEDCECPICAGVGKYELETTPCRIF